MADPDDPYDYFVALPSQDEPDRPPAGLWRRSGTTWEYLSLLDWSWHTVVPGHGPTTPEPDTLRPVTPAQAAELAADRQHWVQYWAWHLRSNEPDRPRTVVRRRSSPELVLDEGFTVDNQWEPTTAIVDFEHAGLVSNPPRLVEIDQLTAERILHEIRGVAGATEL